MSTEVAFASAVLEGSPERRMLEIGRMAGGGLTDRRFAARLADECNDVATLIVLGADRSPIVRGEAAYGLAHAAAEDMNVDPRVLPALRRAVADRGWNTGFGAARVIAETSDQEVFADLPDLLSDHPSREVRRRARPR